MPAAKPLPSASANKPAVEFVIIHGDVPVPLPPLLDVAIVNVGAVIGACLATVICSSVKAEAADKSAGNILSPVNLVWVVKSPLHPDLKTSISIF